MSFLPFPGIPQRSPKYQSRHLKFKTFLAWVKYTRKLKTSRNYKISYRGGVSSIDWLFTSSTYLKNHEWIVVNPTQKHIIRVINANDRFETSESLQCRRKSGRSKTKLRKPKLEPFRSKIKRFLLHIRVP